jgi:hypothetical protein
MNTKNFGFGIFFLKVKNHESSYQIIYEVYQTNC